MKLLSIIIPIYNSQKYLNLTLNAIIAQTYSNLEVIMIDDGSTDQSESICRAIASTDARFHYYKVKNGGPSRARNIGLSYATGDYIGFCDSDDLPTPNMYTTLINSILKTNSELALCDIFSERDQSNFGFPWTSGTVFKDSEVITELASSMIGNSTDDDRKMVVWGSVCRSVFLRSVITKNKITFPENIAFAEDLVFTLRYLIQAASVVICKEPLYYYTCNQESIMNSYFSYKKNMFESRKKLVSYIQEVINKLDNSEDLHKRLAVTERCYYHECIGNACRPTPDRNSKDMRVEIRKIVTDAQVIDVFSKFSTKNIKKYIIYQLIKHKQVNVLYEYYQYRFRTAK